MSKPSNLLLVFSCRLFFFFFTDVESNTYVAKKARQWYDDVACVVVACASLPYLATQLFGLAFCEPLPPVPPIVPEFSIFGKLLNPAPAAI